MPIKKSELYSSLWSSCDELRGGMDASQYKDYVLVLLFIKYVSDKYAGVPYAPITIPKGASFKDMVALKGKSDIGDQINKKIIAPLANANKLSDMPDFNDANKLGTGKEMVERLTNLIAIFENKALDFSKNRAEGDDILGDAYEYLMRHFATESGKSKGQFYTPAEVSRVIAQIIGIHDARTTSSTTVYDPTCGSGSLLLKVGDEATARVTLYGQEKDAATSGLARMNMILHNNPTALIVQGNTLADPKFKDGNTLKTFDYVVANPPFSDKRWSTGLDPLNDPYERFQSFGTGFVCSLLSWQMAQINRMRRIGYVNNRRPVKFGLSGYRIDRLCDSIRAAMVPDISDPTISLMVNGRLICGAPLQIVETYKAHIRRFRRVADFRRLSGDRSAEQQSDNHACNTAL
jgi:type I restriction enzyme M protein